MKMFSELRAAKVNERKTEFLAEGHTATTSVGEERFAI